MKKVLIHTAIEMIKLRAIGQQPHEGIHRAATDLLHLVLRNEVERIKAKQEAIQKEAELQCEVEGACKSCGE